MDGRQALLDRVFQNFGGEGSNAGQQIAFQKVGQDLGFSPVQVALEQTQQNSANAINSSLGISSSSSDPDNLKGYPVTQQFGAKNPDMEVFSGGVNTGVDIGVPQKTPVALPKGRWQVVNSYDQAKTGYIGDKENSGYGNSVLVRNLDTGEQLRFSHLSQVYLPSDSLGGGQVIGLSGKTGNASGPHLDVEYKTAQGQLGDFLQTQYAKDLGL